MYMYTQVINLLKNSIKKQGNLLQFSHSIALSCDQARHRPACRPVHLPHLALIWGERCVLPSTPKTTLYASTFFSTGTAFFSDSVSHHSLLCVVYILHFKSSRPSPFFISFYSRSVMYHSSVTKNAPIICIIIIRGHSSGISAHRNFWG
jgi:hypothetical protein